MDEVLKWLECHRLATDANINEGEKFRFPYLKPLFVQSLMYDSPVVMPFYVRANRRQVMQCRLLKLLSSY